MSIATVMRLFGVAFVLAKIFGVAPVASWTWLWVTAPFWGPYALFLLILLIQLSIHLPFYYFSKTYRRDYDLRQAFKGMKSALREMKR